MKIIIRVISIVLLCTIICGCSSLGSAGSKEQLAKKFYTAYFTGDYESISECCPANMRDFIYKGVRNSGYGYVVRSVSVKLSPAQKASASMLDSIEREYLNEEGLSLFIEEGYLYGGEVTLHYKDDDSTGTHNSFDIWEDEEEEVETRPIPFDVIVAKMDGKWYAFPADL